MEILLDGNLILNKESLFKTLKEQISSDEFYGNSLDALWDVLSYGIDSLVVTIKNRKELEIKETIADCGCSSVKVIKNPISSGEESYIEITFDSRGFHGLQIKNIEIYTNGQIAVLSNSVCE